MAQKKKQSYAELNKKIEENRDNPDFDLIAELQNTNITPEDEKEIRAKAKEIRNKKGSKIPQDASFPHIHGRDSELGTAIIHCLFPKEYQEMKEGFDNYIKNGVGHSLIGVHEADGDGKPGKKLTDEEVEKIDELKGLGNKLVSLLLSVTIAKMLDLDDKKKADEILESIKCFDDLLELKTEKELNVLKAKFGEDIKSVAYRNLIRPYNQALKRGDNKLVGELIQKITHFAIVFM